MNVESGNLAYITFPQYFGLVVTVGEFYGPMCGHPSWWVSCKTPMKCEDGLFKTRFIVPDLYLRRIGGVPPGDDASDGEPHEIRLPSIDAIAVALGITREEWERQWSQVSFGTRQ